MRKIHEDYNLKNQADILKYIKALNTRLVTVAKTFGTNSNIYKNQETIYKQLFGNNIRMNKNNIAQISTSNETLNNDRIRYTLENKKLINKPTTSEFINKTFEKMKERGELDEDVKLNQRLQGPPTAEGIFPTIKQQVIQYAEMVNTLQKKIEEEIKWLYTYNGDPEVQQTLDLLETTGRRKTFEELEEVSRVIDKVKREQNYEYEAF